MSDVTGRDAAVIAALVLQAAEHAASTRGIAACITIVDTAAHPLTFTRMHGATLAGIELSLSKARTCILTGGISTAILTAAMREDPALVAALGAGGGLAILPGGEPVRVGGVIVGAIGVSGVAAESDVDIALEACAAAML